MKDSILHQKSLQLGILISKYSLGLREEKLYDLASQFFRSGTSVGANVHEATGGQSRKDFCHKLQIALGEAHEVLYWCEILEQGFDKDITEIKSIATECLKLLTASIKSLKE